MKKIFVMSAAVAGTIAGAVIGVMTAKKANKGKQTVEETLREAGMPGQVKDQDAAQQENSKMVSEGSQFGVQYFNDPDNMPEEK